MAASGRYGWPRGLAALVVVAANICYAAAAATAEAAQKPRIVLFFLDDNGWGDIGANDPATTETPNIDRLLAEGIRFTDLHAAASVCTPSRAGLLTGRHGLRTGIAGNFGPDSLYGLAETELTIADILKPAGYQSHMIGKWHLGHHVGFHPTFRGFSTYYGLPYSGDMGCIDATPQACKPSYNRSQTQPACPGLCPPDSKPATEPAIPLYDSTSANCSGHTSCNADIAVSPYDPLALNDLYTERAISIIKNTPADAPLFLYIAYAHTHTPLAYNPRFANASSRPGWYKVFGNTLAEVDDSIKRIVAALDDTDTPTAIFIAADNGPADLGSVACESVGSAGPFNGLWQKAPGGGGGGSTLKTTTWEGGHRVVGGVRFRGRVQPAVSNATVSTHDFLPTMATLAGTPLPTDRHYDGVDLSPILFDGESSVRHVMFHQDGSANLTAMRYGQYKGYFLTEGAQPCRQANGSHLPSGKRIEHAPYPLVFDLSTDPGERTPVTLPESVLQAMVQAHADKMQDIHSSFRSKTNYAKGGPPAWPCCNPHSSSCRCD